jgi:hypothetical protein
MKAKVRFFNARYCSALNPKWLILFAILQAGTELRAQTWNAGTGSWFVPENWTPATVPTGASVVTVANGGTAQVVGATASVGTLTGLLQLAGSSLRGIKYWSGFADGFCSGTLKCSANKAPNILSFILL